MPAAIPQAVSHGGILGPFAPTGRLPRERIPHQKHPSLSSPQPETAAAVGKDGGTEVFFGDELKMGHRQRHASGHRTVFLARHGASGRARRGWVGAAEVGWCGGKPNDFSVDAYAHKHMFALHTSCSGSFAPLSPCFQAVSGLAGQCCAGAHTRRVTSSVDDLVCWTAVVSVVVEPRARGCDGVHIRVKSAMLTYFCRCAARVK